MNEHDGQRKMRMTLHFEFNSEDLDRDYAISRAVRAGLTALCQSIQPTGWSWGHIDHDEDGELTMHAPRS